MQRAMLATSFLALAATLASHARADEPASRRGIYLHGALGFAYGADRAMDGSFSGSLSGPGAETRAAMGLAPIEGLAFAFEARFLVHGGRAALDPWGSSSVSSPSLEVVGGLVDFYPDPKGPAHVELGLGAVTASTAAEDSAGDSTAAGPGGFDSMSGAFGHVGAGFTWPVARSVEVGPLLDIYRGRATKDTARIEIYGGALELGVTWF